MSAFNQRFFVHQEEDGLGCPMFGITCSDGTVIHYLSNHRRTVEELASSWQRNEVSMIHVGDLVDDFRRR